MATSHVISDRRHRSRRFVSLDDVDALPPAPDVEHAADRKILLDGVRALIEQLTPLDRQVMLLYLEGFDAAGIGEVTGLSAGNVSTKVHRIKTILRRRIHEGGPDVG